MRLDFGSIPQQEFICGNEIEDIKYFSEAEAALEGEISSFVEQLIGRSSACLVQFSLRRQKVEIEEI